MLFESPSFPNESPAYRQARDELLKAEAELRASSEAAGQPTGCPGTPRR